MLVYTTGTDHELSYRIWDGSGVDGPRIRSPSRAGSIIQQVRLAASSRLERDGARHQQPEAAEGRRAGLERLHLGQCDRSRQLRLQSATRTSTSPTSSRAATPWSSTGRNSEDVYYRTWNGSNWSNEGHASRRRQVSTGDRPLDRPRLGSEQRSSGARGHRRGQGRVAGHVGRRRLGRLPSWPAPTRRTAIGWPSRSPSRAFPATRLAAYATQRGPDGVPDVGRGGRLVTGAGGSRSRAVTPTR